MPGMDPKCAPPARRTAAAGLLYVSAAPYYDAYAGCEPPRPADAARGCGRSRATPRATRCAASRTSTGEVVGVLAGSCCASPTGSRTASSRLRAAAAALALVGVARHLRAAGRSRPDPPRDAFYVDGLAVAEAARRRGVARALLTRRAHRGRRAARPASRSTRAWPTGLPGRSTRRAASAARARTRAGPPAARAIGGDGFVSYFKPSRRSRARAPRRPAPPGPSVIAGKNGSATERAATSSQTGNSPGRWPKRSR